MVVLQSRPITTPTDGRLLGLLDLVSYPSEYEGWIVEQYAWARSMIADSKADLFIARAQIEMPMSYMVWCGLGGATFDNLNTEQACHEIAASSGWTIGQLRDQAGIHRTKPLGYAALASAVICSIRQQRERPVIESWRIFHRRHERERIENE